jgi:ElaB/YqjD/DUF883 family membrane-anchored ribosome-binding protein
MNTNSLLEKTSHFADQAAVSADHALKATQEAVNGAVESVRDTSLQIRENAHRVSEKTAGYIKDEPMKSMLIAAATGAALMAMLSLVSRSNHRH